MRRPGFAAPGFLLFATLLLVGTLGAVPALARQAASPTVGTPAAPPTQPPAPTAAPAAASPAPTAAPTVQATTDVVTLVLWYANSTNRDIIELFPLVTNAGFIASPAPGAKSAGTVDFPEDGVTPPTVVVGDTTFETYPRPDGVIERWTWLDDSDGARPATLVMQLSGANGTYKDYYGTATMMSRDEGGVGGVLILALRPPSPAAAAEQAATPAAAQTASEEQTADVSSEPTAAEADTGIVIEGETPAEGAAPTEPAP
jgi:septal ring-binding cell division protein DamX